MAYGSCSDVTKIVSDSVTSCHAWFLLRAELSVSHGSDDYRASNFLKADGYHKMV